MALSRSDWAQAALDAFARDGLQGVAIQPLARRLNATKGSFYWHFADRGELIDATLELWELRQTTGVIEAIEAIPDPYQRLAALGRGAYASAASGNAHASVLAAASNPRVAPVLKRVTQRRLAFMERLYRDLGLSAKQAIRHARLAYALYIGIGELHRADPGPDIDEPELERSLDLAVQAMVPAALKRDAAHSA